MATRRGKSTRPVEALSPFEGRDVLQSTIAITKAGDGLSDSLAVEPAEFHLGDTVYVVIEATCTKVNYQELKDTGTLRRVHTLAAGTCTLVDKEQVHDMLEAQRIKIEEARGVVRIDFGNEDDGEGEPEPDGDEVSE